MRLLASLVLLALMTCAIAEPRSGRLFQSADVQAMQADEFQNPGMLWVDQGESLFTEKTGEANKACADCHKDLSGVATRYPAINQRTGLLVTLTQQVRVCRVDYQQAPAIEYESDAALSLAVYVASQSQGQPIQPVAGKEKTYADAGKAYFKRRKGQLNLACGHCHERSVGLMLRGDRISEGHGNGYPAYRLEWQQLGSLHRRLRACDIGVRAEPMPIGGQVYTQLELYLRDRAAGLAVETPAVRR